MPASTLCERVWTLVRAATWVELYRETQSDPKKFTFAYALSVSSNEEHTEGSAATGGVAAGGEALAAQSFWALLRRLAKVPTETLR